MTLTIFEFRGRKRTSIRFLIVQSNSELTIIKNSRVKCFNGQRGTGNWFRSARKILSLVCIALGPVLKVSLTHFHGNEPQSRIIELWSQVILGEIYILLYGFWKNLICKSSLHVSSARMIIAKKRSKLEAKEKMFYLWKWSAFELVSRQKKSNREQWGRTRNLLVQCRSNLSFYLVG